MELTIFGHIKVGFSYHHLVVFEVDLIALNTVEENLGHQFRPDRLTRPPLDRWPPRNGPYLKVKISK